jgi:3-oxoacyl-[acyl-carrier protein] reductase
MTGEIAVVSGGTKGIGRALSERLIKLGFRVVGLYRSDLRSAEVAQRELGLTAVRVDVSDADQVTRFATELVDNHGSPRVLVNNAGLNVDRPFLEMSIQDWDRVIGTNLSGVFYLTRALVPHMQPGVVVNVGATTGMRVRRNGANYCASKAGLVQLTKCLALELAPRFRVNCLIPGMTWTEELVERFGLNDPQARAVALAQIPQARIGSTTDIANALEFLVSDQSSYINGQKLIVDGGQFMW